MTIVELPPLERKVEWPTIGLAVVVYGIWFAATYSWRELPWWALGAIGAASIAWHMNLQHEIIHGHPTPWRAVNETIGRWPLSLWLPYPIYVASHLAHHRDERLTDPIDDTESYYWTPQQWAELPRLGCALVAAQSTMLGRVLIGPGWMILRFLVRQMRAVWRGDRNARAIWTRHGLACLPVLVWVVGVCGMPFWLYVAAFVYPGFGLSLVRSFAEHRAAPEPERRTAIVEGSWILGPLFLFNNLHVAHHLRAGVPWYQLPRFYRLNRQALIERNGGLVYRTYFDVARRYFVRPHDVELHPYWGKPAS